MASGQIPNQCGRPQFQENELNQPVELFRGVCLIFQQAEKGINKKPWRGLNIYECMCACNILG